MDSFLVSQLPDFLESSIFNNLRKEMKAEIIPPITEIKMDALVLDKILSTTGKDVDILEIEINSDHTINYKDNRVILHIRDVASYSGNMSLPKYHLANCKTLQRMWENNKSGRYVAATRSDGIFTIKSQNTEKTEWVTREENLDVCKFCLETLNWKNYSRKYQDRENIFSTFDLREFFTVYPNSATTYNAEHNDITAPINDYSKNFQIISKQYRESVNWQCEICNINLTRKDLNKFLHVHHRDGQKNNNNNKNLQALCIECHSNQDNHGHMKNNPQLTPFIQIKNSMVLSES
ncbi:hypothetical protein WCU70_18690 [Pectobacterium atrosepticum]|nr:hypothetical protein EV46_00430 [Pectobacterium atrosepticum]AIK12006.1 hypothetical protein GZ59_00890 [Pectobacterium atrosepticum]POW25730.1 hypothetical protein PB72LOC_03425 [Pectobacterium atrosepticum]